MKDILIRPYREEFNSEALDLERECPQGDSLSLRFIRKNFSDRSRVYDRYRLLCARSGGRLIAIAGATRKLVRLHGRIIRAGYGYDLRVHPDYRKYGTAIKIARQSIADVGETDCLYSFVSGENKKALGLVRRGFGPEVVIPLIYAVIPVFRYRKYQGSFEEVSGETLHERFLSENRGIEFTTEYSPPKMLGHVTSFSDGRATGCSIWTNRELLAESVVRLPRGLAVARRVFSVLDHLVRVPSIPGPGETVQSYFLYDVHARSVGCLKSILRRVGNYAFANGGRYLYLLLQENNPILGFLRSSHILHFRFPYLFLAKGRQCPRQNDRIYIDIRDL